MYTDDFGICGCPECSCEYVFDPIEEESYEKCPPITPEEWAVMEREIDG